MNYIHLAINSLISYNYHYFLKIIFTDSVIYVPKFKYFFSTPRLHFQVTLFALIVILFHFIFLKFLNFELQQCFFLFSTQFHFSQSPLFVVYFRSSNFPYFYQFHIKIFFNYLNWILSHFLFLDNSKFHFLILFVALLLFELIFHILSLFLVNFLIIEWYFY